MIVIPPKGLILAISIGAIAGPVFGIILFDIGVQEQLVYADGTSLSIVTEKINFKLGEEVVIKNHYSVVSPGTERASIEASSKSPVAKAQEKVNIQKGIELLRIEGMASLITALNGKNSVPLQLGYSSSGEVVETGKNVTSFHVGDRVASNGSHAEYVVVAENLCVRLPESVTYKEGAFTVIGSIALHGIRLSETSIGSKVAVIGLGIVGQLVAKIAEAQGSSVVSICLLYTSPSPRD